MQWTLVRKILLRITGDIAYSRHFSRALQTSFNIVPNKYIFFFRRMLYIFPNIRIDLWHDGLP